MLADTEDIYDYSFLKEIDPPQEYPATARDLTENIEANFYSKCSAFLSGESRFYNCSKQIEKKLVYSVQGSNQMHQKIFTSAGQVEKIKRSLKKINEGEHFASHKQEFLAHLCDLIKMESHRHILLDNKIQDQSVYLQALKQLNQTVMELEAWDTQLNIIVQLKSELSQLLEQTIKKLIKDKLSDSMFKKIIGPYSAPLLRDEHISSTFKANLKNNRLNHLRIALNPLVNNINYAQNVSQLYENIVDSWVQLIEEQIDLFTTEGVTDELQDISKEVLGTIVQEIIPKLERNIYKVKQFLQVAKIRYYLFELKKKLVSFNSKQEWDPLPKLLVKSHILLDEQLDHDGEQLEIAKYNIYSLASYIPIREHLENIKLCKAYDTVGLSEVGIDWEKGFKRLVDSRQPSKQPQNKSLILFNFNIWYLYHKILKDGQLSGRCERVLEWCLQKFAQLNLREAHKKFKDQKFEHLIEICSNIEGIKKMIYGEISLLGHEELRRKVEERINGEFVNNIYKGLMMKNEVDEKGYSGSQVKEKAKQMKINMNKYGKMAENLEIYSMGRLAEHFK